MLIGDRRGGWLSLIAIRRGLLLFSMSLSAEISAAFSEAQGTLAEITGAAPGKKNTLYNGTGYLGIYGQPQVSNQQLPSGGYRQRTSVPLTLTREQFEAAPEKNQTLTRLDLDPQITYRIADVNTHDPFHYLLTLIRVGE